MYCSSVRFPLRKDHQHKSTTGEKLRENKRRSRQGGRERESERYLRGEREREKTCKKGMHQVDFGGRKWSEEGLMRVKMR